MRPLMAAYLGHIGVVVGDCGRTFTASKCNFLQGGWAQRGETGFALKRGHAVWKQSPTATMRPQGWMMAASFHRVHAYAYGRGNVSQSGMWKGLLVVYEWKFDGGTTVPPFASKFRDSSIGNSQQPFRFRYCSLVCQVPLSSPHIN